MSKNGKIEFLNQFVHTTNVRNFTVLMDNLELAAGDERFGLVYGQAGRGKTWTSQWWHGRNDSIFLRMKKIWDSRPLDFLQALASECWDLAVSGLRAEDRGIFETPKNKGAAYAAIVEVLQDNPVPVFLDEIEKLPGYFLEVIRDIAMDTTAPFVFIGEDELVAHMAKNLRVWSRTFERYHFSPIDPAGIIAYVGSSTKPGVRLTGPQANMVHDVAGREGRGQKYGGDFRAVRRFMLHLVAILNARGDTVANDADIKTALKIGL